MNFILHIVESELTVFNAFFANTEEALQIFLWSLTSFVVVTNCTVVRLSLVLAKHIKYNTNVNKCEQMWTNVTLLHQWWNGVCFRIAAIISSAAVMWCGQELKPFLYVELKIPMMHRTRAHFYSAQIGNYFLRPGWAILGPFYYQELTKLLHRLSIVW